MRFTFWFYACKMAVGLFLAVFVAMLFESKHPWLSIVKIIAMATLVVLGFVGTIMGFMLALGRLRMICPYCGRSGTVGGNKQEGLWMICDQCGFIHGTGFLGFKLIAEKQDAESSDAPRSTAGQ